MLSRLTVFTLLAIRAVWADQDIFVNGLGALSKGWENWSWKSTFNWADTSISGKSSMNIVVEAWGSVSFIDETPFGTTYAGLQFDFAGDPTQVQFTVQSSNPKNQSPIIPLSAFAKSFAETGFTTCVLDFGNLPGDGGALGTGTWDRINWQALDKGATFNLDNVKLLTSIILQPMFLGAEPLGENLIALTTQGAVDLSTVKVSLGGKDVSVSSWSHYTPVDSPSANINYGILSSSFQPGKLTISAGTESTWNYVLPAVQYGSITTTVNRPISPYIYGINFPTSASYIQHLGVTLSRWGGNAVTAYNPFGGFTNAGNDWYFENRVSENGQADDWIGWVTAAGSETLVAIPALDWVAKDSTSYSYPKTVYPNQKSFDPHHPDAGNGLLPDGSPVTPPVDPNNAYTPWDDKAQSKWLKGLVHKPFIVTVDNEIEIASSTHQDMHNLPMGYDEQLKRVYDTSVAAKAAIPDVLVAAPSTCAWWFYWTSVIGYPDNAAHGNVDFLPWFLAQMNAKSKAAGKRLLDYLDIHYYFAADTSAGDAAALATRLRMTRSFWDPTYIDESKIGTSRPRNHQPNANAVWLIPRMQQLIADNYPGTKLSISEWSSRYDDDVTGGLVVADGLGILGRYGVDSATYWEDPDEKSAAACGYWLYRGYGTYFGDTSVQVKLETPDAANTMGVYAAVDSKTKKLSVVLINKDTKPLALYISNIPAGKYFMRHFGGASGVSKWQTTTTFSQAGLKYLVIPTYTAVFLQQQ